MREISPGEVIGSVECPGCGCDTALKINSKGNVYFFCAKRLGLNPLTGKQEVCLTRMNWGRTGSKKIIDQFLAAEKDKDHAQPEIREPEAGSDESAGGSVTIPEPAPEQSGGLGDAVRKFFS